MAEHLSWSQLSEEELVAAFLAARDPAIFEALRDKFLPRAAAAASAWLSPARGGEEAEDVAREALMQVYLHLDAFDPSRSSFRAWALAFVRRAAARRARS